MGESRKVIRYMEVRGAGLSISGNPELRCERFFSLAGIFGERKQSIRSSGGTLAASAVRPLNKFRRIRCKDGSLA
jgi:hypothetical protein